MRHRRTLSVSRIDMFARIEFIADKFIALRISRNWDELKNRPVAATRPIQSVAELELCIYKTVFLLPTPSPALMGKTGNNSAPFRSLTSPHL